LKFGGQPKTLTVPYAAITQFWDPSIDYRLRFQTPEPPPKIAEAPPAQPAKSAKPAAKDADGPNIVSLDQFRKK